MDYKPWKKRPVGRPKKEELSSPDKLWSAACEYFDWAEATPLLTEKSTFLHDGRVALHKAKLIRPFTLAGLTVWLGIDRRHWNYLRREYDSKSDEDEQALIFSQVMKRIEEIMWTQKFEGAAAGIFHANIIARDLGLKEKSDLSSEDGTMTPSKIVREIVDPKKETTDDG